MQRYRWWIRALACGAVTLGFFQAFSTINYSSIFTTFITQLLSVIVSLLFGVNPFSLFGIQQTTA